jgi:hypothetical protein
MKVKVSAISQDNVEVAKYFEVTESNWERMSKWTIINFVQTELKRQGEKNK